MQLSAMITSFGLLLTIIGAYFAAAAYMRTKLEDIRLQSFIVIGCNMELARSLLIQRNKIITGFILICSGTAFQFIPSFFDLSSTLHIGKELYFGILIFLFVVLLMILEKYNKRVSNHQVSIIGTYDNLLSYVHCSERVEEAKNDDKRREAIQIRNQYRDEIARILGVEVDSLDDFSKEQELLNKAKSLCSSVKLYS